MNNLANIYHFQRKHIEAGKLFRESLAKAMLTLGIIVALIININVSL